MLNKGNLYLFDIDIEQDFETGDTNTVAINVVNCICVIADAGISTQQLGQLQNKQISKALTISKIFYLKEQPFCYLNNRLYEVNNSSPAKMKCDKKLNVVELKDKEIEKAIKEWINGDLRQRTDTGSVGDI